MDNDNSAPINGTDDKTLASVAGILPNLPSPNLDDPDRFAQSVRKLVESRAQSGWPNDPEEGFGVFVLVERPRKLETAFETQPVFDPLATEEQLVGRMFFMNRDCSAGRVIKMPCAQADLLEWLEQHDLGGNALVVAYRETEKMTYRREGVDDAAQDHTIRNSPPTATIEELLEALKQFHLQKTLTPSSCVPGVWEPGRESQYVPGPDPERSIQNGLEFALNFYFRGVVRAEVEDRINIGRIDVRLLKSSKDETGLTYWGIVELKIIKSFRNAKDKDPASKVYRAENVNSLLEGIRQVHSYAANREAEFGILEVFDLRKDKNENLFNDEKVTELLEELSPDAPHTSTKPVFGSASDARKMGFTGV